MDDAIIYKKICGFSGANDNNTNTYLGFGKALICSDYK
jgi:hypothetical protein